MRKKFTATLLAFCLVLGLVPANVLAAAVEAVGEAAATTAGSGSTGVYNNGSDTYSVTPDTYYVAPDTNVTPLTTTTGNNENPTASETSDPATVTVDGKTYVLADVQLPFNDLGSYAWARPGIAYVYLTKIMVGEGDGFYPAGTTKGNMLATMLYRLAGETGVTTGSNWADAPLAWAAENGLTDGIGFNAGSAITREQFVTMLYRYSKLKGYTLAAGGSLASYPDASSVDSFATEAMQWAVAEKIVRGYPDGTIKPNGTASRAEIATIFMRFMESL